MSFDDDTRILLDGLELDDDDTLVDVHCWGDVKARRDESTRMVEHTELMRLLDAAAR